MQQNTVDQQTTIKNLIEDRLGPIREGVGTYVQNGERKNRSFNGPTSFYQAVQGLPTSDHDCAKLVRKAFGNTLTYISVNDTKGEWYFWNGTVHEVVETNDIDDLIAQEIAEILDEVRVARETSMFTNKATLSKEDNDKISAILKDYLEYGKTAKSARGMSNIKTRIRHEYRKSAEYFDHDTDYIVLADGKVLLTSDLSIPAQDPDPSRPVTNKLAATLDDKDVKPGLWADFLNRLGLAADDQKYLQLMAGAALLGRADAKNIAALVGVSNTGKTSYAMSLFKLFGGYAGNLPAGAIVDKGSVNFDQYKARGKRFLLLEEPYEKRTDDSFLKNLSGAGGLVSTQEKGKNGVEWKPQGVLHITANHVPRIDTRDDAIVARMNIVGFNIKGAKIVDPEGLEPADIHMRDCRAEMLRWVLAGAWEYNQTRTIKLSEAISRSARLNVANGSVVIRWLLEQTEWDGDTPPRWELGSTTTHSAMVKASKDEYFNFNLWCGNNNEKVVSRDAWRSEINRFMGEPDDKKDKRPGGSVRLWGVSERDNKKTMEAIELRDSASLAQNPIFSPQNAR